MKRNPIDKLIKFYAANYVVQKDWNSCLNRPQTTDICNIQNSSWKLIVVITFRLLCRKTVNIQEIISLK